MGGYEDHVQMIKAPGNREHMDDIRDLAIRRGLGENMGMVHGTWGNLDRYYGEKIDGVGSALLLVQARVHRAGVNFPDAPYKHRLESEGFGLMAKDKGFQPCGYPFYEVAHGKILSSGLVSSSWDEGQGVPVAFGDYLELHSLTNDSRTTLLPEKRVDSTFDALPLTNRKLRSNNVEVQPGSQPQDAVELQSGSQAQLTLLELQSRNHPQPAVAYIFNSIIATSGGLSGGILILLIMLLLVRLCRRRRMDKDVKST